MDVEKYIEEVFGEKIDIHESLIVQKLPLYLANEYEYFECKIHDEDCILLKPIYGRILTDKILKHLAKLREYTMYRAILVFDDLRSTQRRKLVENRIPFIVPERQIYLPFICLDFNERVELKQTQIEKFTPVTQLVYLWILRQQQNEVITKVITETLNIAHVSANRAIRQLVDLGLVVESGHATRKSYARIKKMEFWEKGKGYMVSPVQNTIFLRELPAGIRLYLSEDSALAQQSMLAEPKIATYAANKRDEVTIHKGLILNDYEINGEVYFKLQLWKYDPGKLASEGVVDVFSLYATYMNELDPRIEIELDTLLAEALCVD